MNYKCTHNYPGGPDVGYISKPHKVQPKTDENCHYYNHNWFNPKLYPEFWEKVDDTILFTTVDGVNLIKGDKCYGVGYDFSLWTYFVDNPYNKDYLVSHKIFSTQQKASNYIHENKPQYSKKDILSFTRYCGFHYEDVDRYFDDYIKKLKK